MDDDKERERAAVDVFIFAYYAIIDGGGSGGDDDGYFDGRVLLQRVGFSVFYRDDDRDRESGRTAAR